jgi:RNA polymerase sigma factor (sigma-70 family)
LADEELIEEISKGSHAAMEVLVKRYYKTVFAYIYRKLGDYHAALDLTQEVFIKMLKSLPSYRARNKFEHWIIKIAVNSCRDYFRSRQYSEQCNIISLDESCVEPNVCNLLEKSLTRQEIKAAVLSLPEEQKETILLYFYNGYKIKEIAKLTQAKEATVKSRLHQALSKLKKTIGGEWYARKG